MTQLTLIALGTFVSEDLACIAAGVLVAQGQLEFIPAVLACFAGIFAGDLALYLAGRIGGETAGRWLRGPQVASASDWLQRRGLAAVVLSRFTPGLRLPVYLAAGFLKLPIKSFAGHLLLAAGAWTPLLVGLAVFFGERILQIASLPVAMLSVFALWRSGRLLANFEERRKLVGFLKRKFRWEFWPSWAIYLPLAPYFLYLAIKHRSLTVFTAVNPGMPSSGLVGESKVDILRRLGSVAGAAPQFDILPATASADDRLTRASAWRFPFVLKPDVGERGRDVAVVRCQEELVRYLESHTGDTILQEYVPGLEFGIFYVRWPGQAAGRVVSITEKTFPCLRGDGVRTLRELVLNDARAVCLAGAYLTANAHLRGRIPAAGENVQLVELGSHCRGAIFLDGSRLITPALNEAIDRIAKAHLGFYLGRFDVRTASAEALQAGQLQVIELNGVSSEPTHIYDPAIGLWNAYSTIAQQWRTVFEIGAINRKAGAMALTFRELIALVFLPERRTKKRNLSPMQEQYSR